MLNGNRSLQPCPHKAWIMKKKKKKRLNICSSKYPSTRRGSLGAEKLQRWELCLSGRVNLSLAPLLHPCSLSLSLALSLPHTHTERLLGCHMLIRGLLGEKAPIIPLSQHSAWTSVGEISHRSRCRNPAECCPHLKNSRASQRVSVAFYVQVLSNGKLVAPLCCGYRELP